MANRKQNDELLSKVLASHDSTMQEINFLNTVLGFLNRKTRYLAQPNANTQIQAIVQKHIEKAKQKENARKAKKKAKKSKKSNKTTKDGATKEKIESTEVGTSTSTNTNSNTTSESIAVGTDMCVGTDDAPIITTDNNNNNKTETTKEAKEDSDTEVVDLDSDDKLVGNGGTTDKYVWTQTLEEVELKINIPKECKGKDCLIKFEDKHLSVALKQNKSEYIINGELHDFIDCDECTWQLDQEYGSLFKTLTIFLRKQKGMNWWNKVIVGDPEIDTTKIEPANSKLDDLEPDVRQTVEKMMVDQRAKMQGLPTTKEREQAAILEKFKAQHPEMDFSNVKFG